MTKREYLEKDYRDALSKYLAEQTEQALYLGQKISKSAMESDISPEEIISIHQNALKQIFPELSKDEMHALDFLLEVMLEYGVAFRELQSLRHQQRELKSEMEIATNVQQTLLGTNIPVIDNLDIGAISVPAKHMSGDYFHFVEDEHKRVAVAIADIIGKGIPAALCMSMIKYAMDSLPENRTSPASVLESINRVVEQNVDSSMFITMFYGLYDPSNHIFTYASAGHEPGFFYDYRENEFKELTARGLLLGVDKRTVYKQYERKIEVGDMIILLSDGVTECRTNEGFIERDTLVELIQDSIHLDAQSIVNNLYKKLEKMQHFQLRDDFTLIIIRRKF